MSVTSLGVLKWSHFFFVALLFAIIYLVALWITMSSDRDRRILSQVQIRFMRYLFVPIVSFILTAIFIGINPIVHGSFIVLMYLGFGGWIRNAITGAFIKYKQHYQKGQYYTIEGQRVRLLNMGHYQAVFGKPEGRLYVPFERLYSIAVLHDHSQGQPASISVSTTESKIDRNKIRAVLFDCPLLVADEEPYINIMTESSAQLDVSLRSGIALSTFAQYLKDRLPNHHINNK